MRDDEMPGPEHDWLDLDAGPVVRPYMMTGGRVRPAVGGFDLVAFVVAAVASGDGRAEGLQPEHRHILRMSQEPISVAEVASYLDLPLGVVRVLLADLLTAELIAMHEPSSEPSFPEDDILKAVVNGLRAL
ncbi:DUF742 domain-containing protein [Micromonospora sp. NPDC050417]|uniref:DUF742 domain-containing protein n=1 Tax=Micromonospora sp. NPDC050417 TaxID=3364280 RepID=UPI0037997DB7